MEVRPPKASRESAGVYVIRNRATKDIYVGSAVMFRARWNLHRGRLRAGKHHNQHLQAAWDKYGERYFEFFVVGVYPRDDVVREEQAFIDMLSPQYNICKVARSRAGVRNSTEHNAAISSKAKERWADAEFRARVIDKLRRAERPPPKINCRTIVLTAFGKTQYLAQWARETGIRRETIRYRLNNGYSPEDALDPASKRKGSAAK